MRPHTPSFFCANCCLKGLAIVFLAYGSRVAADIHNDSPEDLFRLSLEELSAISVSIATGTENTLEQAPAVASVITAESIRNLSARTLDEVLETVPGLHVSLSNINRLDSIYSIRGIHAGFNPHVLVLVDGNPLQWTLMGGRPFLYRIPATSIARIEIVRGPGSALYGSDAFSGVINVITKANSELPNNELGIRYGSFATRDAWLNFQAKLEDWTVSGSLSVLSTDGDSGRVIDADMQTFLDQQFGTKASTAPGPLETGYNILDVRFRVRNSDWSYGFSGWSSRDTGTGIGGAQTLDPDLKENYRSYSFDTRWHPSASFMGWHHTFSAAYFNHRIDGNLKLLPDGAHVPIGADGNINMMQPVGVVIFPDGMIGQPGGITEDTSFEWVITRNFGVSHSVRIASGYRIHTLDSREHKNFGPGVIDGTEGVVDGVLRDVSDTDFVFVPNTERRAYHFAVQDEWALSDSWRFTGGIRFDEYSDFGNTTNPRMALVWDKGKISTKLIYGSAFRAPSFSELLYQNNPVSQGNPELSPETINTREIAFIYRPWEDFIANVNVYYYHARNMISFRPGDVGLIAQNVRRQKGDGVEAEFSWKPGPGLSLVLNGAWQNSEDIESGVRVARAPARLVSAIVNWEFRTDWLLNIFYNQVSGRTRRQHDYRSPIEDYATTNIHVKRMNLISGLDVAFKCNNVFDADAREPSLPMIPNDHPLEGRGIWMELLYRFDY